MNHQRSDVLTIVDFEMRPSPEWAGVKLSLLAGDPRGLGRLDPLLDPHANIDWDRIDASVQAVFDQIEAEVRSEIPEVLSRRGRSSAPAYALFTYRTFSIPGCEDGDPIVVELTCTVVDDEVLIGGDISGEASGRICWDQDCQGTAYAATAPIEGTANRVAGLLALGQSSLIDAIQGIRLTLRSG